VPRLESLLESVDLLVCEGTYASDEDLPKAVRNGHMTFPEAATLARDVNAKRLWITHFSPALETPSEFAVNATNVFPQAEIGHDGLMISLPFPEE
jgi:ribonuclease Z